MNPSRGTVQHSRPPLFHASPQIRRSPPDMNPSRGCAKPSLPHPKTFQPDIRRSPAHADDSHEDLRRPPPSMKPVPPHMASSPPAPGAFSCVREPSGSADGTGVHHNRAGVRQDGAGVHWNGRGVRTHGAGVPRTSAFVSPNSASVLLNGTGVRMDGTVFALFFGRAMPNDRLAPLMMIRSTPAAGGVRQAACSHITGMLRPVSGTRCPGPGSPPGASIPGAGRGRVPHPERQFRGRSAFAIPPRAGRWARHMHPHERVARRAARRVARRRRR